MDALSLKDRITQIDNETLPEAAKLANGVIANSATLVDGLIEKSAGLIGQLLDGAALEGDKLVNNGNAFLDRIEGILERGLIGKLNGNIPFEIQLKEKKN